MFSAVEGMVKMLLYALSSTAIVVLLMVTTALAWGGPGTPAPMQSINDPFKSVDFSHIPPLKNYQGADGAQLFYREYAPQGDNMKDMAHLVIKDILISLASWNLTCRCLIKLCSRLAPRP